MVRTRLGSMQLPPPVRMVIMIARSLLAQSVLQSEKPPVTSYAIRAKRQRLPDGIGPSRIAQNGTDITD